MELFGYVKISKDELKVKDYYTYRAYYCGLCFELGKRHNQLTRLSLSYELTALALLLDSLSDEQFTIYQALFDQRFGDVDSDELLSVKDLINMTYGLDNVMVASNIHNDEQLGQFVIENDLHPDVAAIPDDSLYLLD